MDPSANLRDERIKIKSRNVSIKNRSFNAYLTNKRLILLDSDDPRGESSRDINRNDIVMARTGEDLSGTPTLNLSVKASNGEIKRMIITFIGAPDERSDELKEWISELREGILSQKEDEKDSFGTGESYVTPPKTEPGIPVPPAPEPIARPGTTPQPSGRFAFCPNCGEKLISNSRFCHACGADLGTPGVESSTPKAPVASAPQVPPAMPRRPEQPPISDPLMQNGSSFGASQKPPGQRYDQVTPVINDRVSLGSQYDRRHDPMGYPPNYPPGMQEPVEQQPTGAYPPGGDIGYPPVYDEQKKRGRTKKQKAPKQKKAKPPKPPKIKKAKKGKVDAISGRPTDYGYRESGGGKGKIIGMAVVGIVVVIVVLAAMGHLPFLKLPVSGDTSTATPAATTVPSAGSTTSPTSAPASSPSAGQTDLTNVLDSFMSAFNSDNNKGVFSLYSDSVKAGGVTLDTIQDQIDAKLDENEMIGYNVITYYPDGNSLFLEITTLDRSTGNLKDVSIPKTIPFEDDNGVWKINLALPIY